MAVLSQQPYVFAASIADNIRLGSPTASIEAIRTAAELACVTDFADSLPAGLDTIIGEAGLGLSGGEIQRVALARIFLRHPDIMLLDEPTAHLDLETERRVLDNILAFAARRTLIVTTHSPAVAARMAKVLRLSGGKLLPSAPFGQPAPRPSIRSVA
jgi:ATP-binding cassette subfamily C protein CydD